MDIFGYFDAPEQTIPAFDPGLSVPCPHCGMELEGPIVTTSLMRMDRAGWRSYFYRSHKPCAEWATDEDKLLIESAIIDAPDREADDAVLSAPDISINEELEDAEKEK